MKGTTDSKHVPRRERPICTKRLIDIVRKRGQTIMMRIVKDDFRLKAHKMQRQHLNSAPTKQKRLDRERKNALGNFQRQQQSFKWSDEKIVTVEAELNCFSTP